MQKSLYSLCILFLGVGLATASQPGASNQTGVVEVQSLRTGGEYDREAFLEKQQRLLTWLVTEQVEAGLVSPVSINLTEQEIRDIERGTCEGCQAAPEGLIAGMVKPVDAHFDLASPSHGAWQPTDDGGVVWTAAIHSNGARGLRVHFADFNLPAGFELWLYSDEGMVRGPYTDRGPDDSGDFWSHTINGPDAVLQLRGHGPVLPDNHAAFSIVDLGHVGTAPAVKEFCAGNQTAWCVENGECFTVSAVNDAKLAVAHMQYVKRPYLYFCSGGLLNDTIGSRTPYFLTANHCISRDREAGTLEAFFQFTIPCDSSDCPDYNAINSPTTLGSTVLATNKSSDFTLLQLSQTPPDGSAFMGWTNAPVVGTEAELHRISHPQGAPQAYSKHVESGPVVLCTSWPEGPWIYSHDLIGATQGGSSGSPVVNASGQVVGQLSGGCGTNVYEDCDAVSNATVDGALAAYYDQVAPWLDPGGGCTDNDSDGSCVEDDCDDNDPLNFPGNIENCTDGQDNDCDGDIDDADPDCDTTCLPRGDACTSGDECCSGLCHPRKLTCK